MQEKLETFRDLPHIPYPEALALLKSCFPERATIIERKLENDIKQEKLTVYSDTQYFPGGELALPSPEPVTKSTLQYYIPQPDKHEGLFWIFCLFSTQELKDWLQEKEGIPSSYFEKIRFKKVADTTSNHSNGKPDATKQDTDNRPAAQLPAKTGSIEGQTMKADKSNDPFMISFEEIIKDIDPNDISPQLVANNYLLIGILLEFIVGKYKDLNPKNQSELADYIEERYYKDGVRAVSKRNVNKKFAIGNTLKQMLAKAQKQHDEALKR